MPYAMGPQKTRLYYEVAGTTGPYVVLIQGLGLSARFWFDLPRRLTATGYRVVTLDNRGVGQSDCPRGPYTMARMADDVAAVLDAADIRSAHIVGISLGGMIAQHVALRHPERTAGLVLLATTPGLPHGRLPSPRNLAALLSLGFARRDRPGRALSRLLLSAKHLPRAREILVDWPAAMQDNPASLRAFTAQLAAVVGHSTGFRLKKIRCPTVVVAGADDILVPPHNGRILARLIPNAQLDVVPDCGHGIPLIDEEVVHRALEKLGALAGS